MDLASLQQLLQRVAGARVVAVGDLMVDRFVYGEVARISPEAPIPVMARTRESVMLGAAGNVARNVAALGARGGAGRGGRQGRRRPRQARGLIAAEPRIEGYLITDPDRPTTIKTRFVSAGQQLLRVDEETDAARRRRRRAPAGAARCSDAARGRWRDPALRLRQGRRHARR